MIIRNDNRVLITLTQSQINNLSTTPYELIKAPGANSIIVVNQIVYDGAGVTPRYKWDTGPSDNLDMAITFYGGTSVIGSTQSLATRALDNKTAIINISDNPLDQNSYPTNLNYNMPIMLVTVKENDHLTVAAPSQGDGSMTLLVNYNVYEI